MLLLKATKIPMAQMLMVTKMMTTMITGEDVDFSVIFHGILVLILTIEVL